MAKLFVDHYFKENDAVPQDATINRHSKLNIRSASEESKGDNESRAWLDSIIAPKHRPFREPMRHYRQS